MLIGNRWKRTRRALFDQDQAVATFSLATTERGYTLQNGTKVPDHTDWHTVMAWRGLAKIVEKYVHKGDKLYIEGRIRYRSYDDQKGQRRFVTEILAENMELLTPRPVANENVCWTINCSRSNATNQPTGRLKTRPMTEVYHFSS